MDRRSFFKTVALSAGSLLLSPNKVLAGLNCIQNTPFVRTCETGIDSFSLVSAFQQQNEWCWAACIEMVFNHYGHPVSQQRIVEETWGGIVNMPAQPGQILADLNRSWKDDRQQEFSVSGQMLPLRADFAAQSLADDKPLIIGALGHAVVLTAMTYVGNAMGQVQIRSVVVRDPWPGRGRRILTPQEWANVIFAVSVDAS